LKNFKNLHGFFVSFALPAFLISALLLSSCQKGNQGAAGAPGAPGATGAQGATGNTILSGDGTPSSTLGNNGDYYLEMDSSYIYGPKTPAGWGSPVSLTGASGAAGASGGGLLVDTFSVNTTDWTTQGEAYAQNSNSFGYAYATQIYTRSNSNVTAGILDSGMVLVYFTAAEGFVQNQWLPLPYSIAENFGNPQIPLQYNWSYQTSTNQIMLQFYLTPLDTTKNALPAVSTATIPNAKYKIIVVPGTLTHEIITAIHKKVSKMGHISID
jgi:hypothetical protein